MYIPMRKAGEKYIRGNTWKLFDHPVPTFPIRNTAEIVIEQPEALPI